jgi:hypothetical protein
MAKRPPAKAASAPLLVDLALQGGGAHGAFAWGVLDRLLEEPWLGIDGISGTSAGAMNAAVLIDGHAQGGPEGARAALEGFWRRVARAARFSPFQRSPLDVLLGRWTMDTSPAFIALDLAARLVSPYDLNPTGANPLRDILAESIDFSRLARAPIKLFVTTTNVRTGQGRIFRNRDVTPDALLASACLPSLFQAVEIDGEAYWERLRLALPSDTCSHAAHRYRQAGISAPRRGRREADARRQTRAAADCGHRGEPQGTWQRLRVLAVPGNEPCGPGDAGQSLDLPASVSPAAWRRSQRPLSPAPDDPRRQLPGVAFVLAFSQNAARLIEVTPDGPAEEVAVSDMPVSLAQVIARTDRRSPESPTRQAGEGQKVLIRKYAREVDAAIRGLLAGRRTPLFLACVESLAPIYRSVNSYPNLAQEVIGGNVEHLSAGEIAEQAREILRQHNDRAVAALRDRYETWTGIGRAMGDLAHVGRAVSSGAVHTLLFDIDGAIPGRIDDQTGAIEIEPQASASSYDIVDELVGRTILYGGEVVGVRRGDLPDPNSPVAALLRFPM